MTVEERIEVIRKNYEFAVSNFEFWKIKVVMNALDWKWGFSEMRTPSVDEMEETVGELFESVLSQLKDGQEEGNCSSGGFKVIVYPNNLVVVQFIAEDSDSEFSNEK